MAYDGKLLARARLRLQDIKSENQAEQYRRQAEVYARVPEIQRLDGEMREQMTELVRITVSRPVDMNEKLAALERENLDCQMRRAELLVENGYTVEYLNDIYSCPDCRDTGVLNGGVCHCLDKLYNRELTKELGVLMQNGSECFERFDLNLYSDRLDPRSGVIPRDAMRIVRDAGRKFADNFPNVSSNLLFQGGPGLGKTFLSACIARVVAEKGCSVCYDSAASALEAFEKQKFSRDPDEADAASARVRRMLDCDLMILDDLGTEMVTPMSVSALYTLINTRLVNRRKMIISTNCSEEELAKRYSPQIGSRLEGEFLWLHFAGSDIRTRKGV